MKPKGMILDICSMRSHAMKLLDTDPPYVDFLKAITSEDFYYDDEIPVPSLKDLSQMAGISYHLARKHLKLLYNDLCLPDPEIDFPMEFRSCIIGFMLKGFREDKYFQVKGLPYLPKQGESITLPFFNQFTGTNFYYVEEISHTFYDGEQEIFIVLKYGFYNSYWQLRKDQARFTGEIALMDFFDKSDMELKQALRIRPFKAW